MMPSTRFRPLRLALVALTASAAAMLLIAAPASAHDNLLDSTPSAGETVTSLDEVSLTFSGELIDFDQTSFAQVQGPDGLYYETSCSTTELNVLTTPIALGAAGTYTIVWNAVSSDGHPISESYDFQYAPAAAAEPALGWDLPACRNEEARVQPGAAPAASPTPTENAEDSAASPTPAETNATTDTAGEDVVVVSVIAALIVLAAIIAAGAWFLRSRRRRAE